MNVPAVVSASALALLSVACSKEPESIRSTSSVAPALQASTSNAPAAAAAPPTGALSLDTEVPKCDHGMKGQPASATAVQVGTDVRVSVKGYQTYCSSDAKYSVTKDGDTIHITGSKPTTVSRCVCVQELGFVVHNVGSGSHTVSVEETPYVPADAATVKVIATASVVPSR